MEIGNLGSLYLDDARFAASSAGIGKNAMGDGLRRPGGTGGMPGFAELLEKSYGKPGGAEAAGPPPKSSSTSPSPVVDKTDKLYEQCEALETFMVKILINGMRNTVQKSGLIDEGFAGKMYEDMLYDEYAMDFTKNAGFGLANWPIWNSPGSGAK